MVFADDAEAFLPRWNRQENPAPLFPCVSPKKKGSLAICGLNHEALSGKAASGWHLQGVQAPGPHVPAVLAKHNPGNTCKNEEKRPYHRGFECVLAADFAAEKSDFAADFAADFAGGFCGGFCGGFFGHRGFRDPSSQRLQNTIKIGILCFPRLFPGIFPTLFPEAFECGSPPGNEGSGKPPWVWGSLQGGFSWDTDSSQPGHPP